MQQYGYSLIAITGGAMLVSAINRPADSLWPRMLSAGWLRAFGKYSYGLYLIHAPVMRAVREYVFNPEEYETLGIAPWNAQVLFYGAATAPAFALAWLSWRLFEAPILRLKARFPDQRGDPTRKKKAKKKRWDDSGLYWPSRAAPALGGHDPKRYAE